MKSLLHASSLALLLAACTPAHNASDSNTAAAAAKPKATILTKGTYLVSLQGEKACYRQELLVSKTIEFAQDEMKQDKVTLKAKSVVSDNQVRPASCMQPKDSYVTIILDIANKTELALDSLTLTKVEKITATSEVEIDNQQSTQLSAGRYWLQLERPELCNPGEVNYKKKIEYSPKDGGLDIYYYEEGGRVVDNLIRPAVCRSGIASFNAYLELSKDARLGSVSMRLKSIRKIDSVK